MCVREREREREREMRIIYASLYVFVKLCEHVRVCELLMYCFDAEEEGLAVLQNVGNSTPIHDTVTRSRRTESSGGTRLVARLTFFFGAIKVK